MSYKVANFGEITCPDCGEKVLRNSPNQKRCKPCALKAHGETGLRFSPRPCVLCGAMIEHPTAPHQKYHPYCYSIRKKQRATERMREYRNENPEMFKKLHKTAYNKKWFDGLREEIFSRDNHKCTMCGCVEVGRLRVHHIDRKGRNAGDNERNNDPANLITVCINCHAKIHFSEPRKPKITQPVNT